MWDNTVNSVGEECESGLKSAFNLSRSYCYKLPIGIWWCMQVYGGVVGVVC